MDWDGGIAMSGAADFLWMAGQLFEVPGRMCYYYI